MLSWILLRDSCCWELPNVSSLLHDTWQHFIVLVKRTCGQLSSRKYLSAVLICYIISCSVYQSIFMAFNADPAKRSAGHFGMLGLLVMLGSTICGAVQQLHWTPKGFKFFNWTDHKFIRYVLSFCLTGQYFVNAAYATSFKGNFWYLAGSFLPFR